MFGRYVQESFWKNYFLRTALILFICLQMHAICSSCYRVVSEPSSSCCYICKPSYTIYAEDLTSYILPDQNTSVSRVSKQRLNGLHENQLHYCV